MTQSLSGLLSKSAEYLDEYDDTGLGFALRELLANLTELHERRGEGVAVLNEFFFGLHGGGTEMTPRSIEVTEEGK